MGVGLPEAENDQAHMASDAMTALWTMPFNFMRMMHDMQIDTMHAWGRAFLQAPHHRHEPASQLEVPDPLEDDFEHDLFA